MPSFTILTFGTRDFSRSVRIQRANALRFGADCHVTYDESSRPVVSALQENPALDTSSRGYGFWIWKPYVILDTLSRLEDGAYAIYLDAGVSPVGDLRPWFARLERSTVNVFAPSPSFALRCYAKRECLVGMAADSREFHEAPILSAGIQAYRKSAESMAFLEELKGLMRNLSLLTDAERPDGPPTYDDFVAHRHDQSILTVLALKRGYTAQCEPSQYGLQTPSTTPRPAEDVLQVLDVHRGRNRRNAALYAAWRLRRKLLVAGRGIATI